MTPPGLRDGPAGRSPSTSTQLLSRPDVVTRQLPNILHQFTSIAISYLSTVHTMHAAAATVITGGRQLLSSGSKLLILLAAVDGLTVT